jgi:flagellar biosynthesis protein FlhF
VKIKTYLAKNIEEAISLIEKDLGKDAYILSQKKVAKKRKSNQSGEDILEVTAAVDNARPLRETKSDALPTGKSDNTAPEQVEQDKDKIFSKLRPGPEEMAPAKTGSGRDRAIVDLSNIKDEMRPVNLEMSEIKKILRADTANFNGLTEFTGIFFDLYLDLVENGVEKKLAGKLIQTLQFSTEADNISDSRVIREQLFNLLTSSISPPAPLKLEKGKRKVVVVMGPTGSGKTTTIAKLSSYFKLMESRKVALVTIDSYRIGAEAHLRTYADILDVPFYSVYDEQDLEFRLNRLTGFDAVFLDTAGRSPNDKKGLLIMEKHLSGIPGKEKEVYLTLSASTRSADLYHSFQKYNLFKPDKFIFSKIDESLSLGNIYNLKIRTDIPAAYFTTGQRVPEDIEIAYPERFARRVFLDYNIKTGENG